MCFTLPRELFKGIKMLELGFQNVHVLVFNNKTFLSYELNVNCYQNCHSLCKQYIFVNPLDLNDVPCCLAKQF